MKEEQVNGTVVQYICNLLLCMNISSFIMLVSFLPVFTPVKAPVNSGVDRDGIIILEGKYQERNIFIANAFGSGGLGYCTYEIRVNGDLITDDINSSAFEVDLSSLKLEMGDDVVIEIRHKNGCTPKVINPGGLTPKPTFEVEDIFINEEGFLEWITKNEYGSLPFTIQQYKWNKWLDIGEVQGMGIPSTNNYAFHVDFVSGLNKYRVIQKDGKGKIKRSPSTQVVSDQPKLTFLYNKKTGNLVFSGKTRYELYDKFGRIIIRGYGSTVDVSTLSKDEYWVCFDNLTERFKK